MELLRVNRIEYLNVSYSVGKGGVNNRDDVMLVEAILKVLDDKWVGGVPRGRRPSPNGTATNETFGLIYKFQVAHQKATSSPRPIRDGFINKAKGGRCVPGTNRPWTIIAMSDALVETMLLETTRDITPRAFLLLKFPQMALAFSKLRIDNVIDI
jgi:hypothetical protein